MISKKLFFVRVTMKLIVNVRTKWLSWKSKTPVISEIITKKHQLAIKRA